LVLRSTSPVPLKLVRRAKYVFGLGTDFTDVAAGDGLACSAKRYAGSRSRKSRAAAAKMAATRLYCVQTDRFEAKKKPDGDSLIERCILSCAA